MTEPTETLTEEAASSVASKSDGDLVSTMAEAPIPSADKPAEEPPKTEDPPKGKEGVKPGEDDAKKGDDLKGDEDRFDKIPRFQELIQSNQTLKEQVKTLQSQMTEKDKPKVETEKDPEYKDISKLSPEKIREWMDEDPVGYTANLAKQIRTELTKDFDEKLSEKSKEDGVLKTFSEYAEKNEDFDPMWESGEIQRYMDKHPGHNAISAHMAITMEAKIKAAEEKTAKETEERVTKDFKAKKGAKVLDAGPTTTGTAQDETAPELKDPKKFGGVNVVLASRLKQRRAGQT